MSIRIDPDEHESIRLTGVDVRTVPPDRLEFAIEGTLTVGSALLAEFEGATLNPVAVTVSTADSEPVSIDLTGPASVRLEDVDVGIAAPDGEDIADDIRAVRPSTDGADSVDSPSGVIAFTVEGTIRGLTATTFEPIADDGPTIDSVEFAVDEPIRGDGGSETDVIFELTLFGYGITVRRDGAIGIGTGGRSFGVDPRDWEHGS
ncbi:hypothetical protein [Natrinema salsiterrestre]|uniref:Uncharacterized protein n=1 Tax=Natrinema salsiterrestre TaxID=2950540 RepID=A0A9Q4L4S0_9EURY|nr:hypothetical protein [Natrinema salsiterrestre]MDF9746833.1 hypothetical protein [Natrinema salsiterrestre]